MGRTTLRDDYILWLYKLLGKLKPSYLKLCKELHRKKFRWFIRNDDNRCDDGKELRERFVEDTRLDETHTEVRYFLKEDCSVLEVLVGLAQRMNDLMYDLNDTQKNRSGEFFYQMLENLRLDRFLDNRSPDGRFPPVDEAEIDEILEVMMDRTYAVDGRGGIFPLKKRHREDQTEVEIWYQMMLWLDENYG